MGLIIDVLATMRNGAADRLASEILTKVVQAVQATDKKGSLIIKLDISKLKGGDTELEIKASISHKTPTEDIPMGIYYPDADGSLHRTDPRQLTMDDRLNSDGKTIDLAARRVGLTGSDL